MGDFLLLPVDRLQILWSQSWSSSRVTLLLLLGFDWWLFMMEGPFDYTDSNFFADTADSEDTALGDIKHFTKLPARNSPVLYPSGVASNF